MIALLLDHLWQSSLFLAGAGLLTLALRRNSANVRFWLWFAASAKFLMPFAIFAALGSYFRTPITLPLSAPSLILMEPVAQPFSGPKPVLAMTNLAAAPAPTHLDFSLILLALWAIGFLVISARWMVRWWQLRLLLRDAVASPLVAPIAVKFSASRFEPGLVGVFRPVIVLPQGIEQQLSPAEMNAIVAHELCHWRRRDNLLAAFHMLVETQFWFFPLVWWLGARLNAERERACDESVLAAGNDPKTYAEGILKVCRVYLQSPLVCAAGVSGAGLKKRMEIIMENKPSVRLGRIKTAFLAGVALAALALPVVLGVAAAPPALAQAAAPDATITPEQIAEHRAEQALPRQAVPFNAKDFDKYVGYYQLGPTFVFTIHRDGSHFLGRLTGQTDVEFFPESPTKFFASVVQAQISFDADASGKVTRLVLHQNGLEQPAPRIEEAAAKKIEADLTARVKAGKPAPGTEAALRVHLESMASGKLDLSAMTPTLAAIAKSQLPWNVQNIQSLGPIKSITFKSVAPGGLDIYDVTFAKGAMEWRVAPLDADGKVSSIGGRPIP